mmetsp:Transcript_80331/g.260333  ORF Transcript_80331/g.260333 Transcript_80331/m.260333 type:complete len:289 (+) Transcript_80331:2015-2881(+)
MITEKWNRDHPLAPLPEARASTSLRAGAGCCRTRHGGCGGLHGLAGNGRADAPSYHQGRLPRHRRRLPRRRVRSWSNMHRVDRPLMHCSRTRTGRSVRVDISWDNCGAHSSVSRAHRRSRCQVPACPLRARSRQLLGGSKPFRDPGGSERCWQGTPAGLPHATSAEGPIRGHRGWHAKMVRHQRAPARTCIPGVRALRSFHTKYRSWGRRLEEHVAIHGAPRAGAHCVERRSGIGAWRPLRLPAGGSLSQPWIPLRHRPAVWRGSPSRNRRPRKVPTTSPITATQLLD